AVDVAQANRPGRGAIGHPEALPVVGEEDDAIADRDDALGIVGIEGGPVRKELRRLARAGRRAVADPQLAAKGVFRAWATEEKVVAGDDDAAADGGGERGQHLGAAARAVGDGESAVRREDEAVAEETEDPREARTAPGLQIGGDRRAGRRPGAGSKLVAGR